MFAAHARGRLLLCGALAFIGATACAQDGNAPNRSIAKSAVTVIELPPPNAGLPGAGRQRSHHALSFSTDAPKPFLRSLGIDATECSVRLRLPTRIKPSRESSSGLAVDVQAQAGLGCRF
jgi:hypothetical protein